MKGYNYDEFFLSYNKILNRLRIMKLKTVTGNEIDEHDLRKAIQVMQKKHLNCRWKSERIRSRRHYILMEGFYWLVFVYFQNDKKQIDADIDFFLQRIKQYEELLKLEHKENWWNENMGMKQLCNYFNKKENTVRKAIKRMCDNGLSEYKFLVDGKVVISNKGVEWICKNIFKQKYLELLEKYKMELTELYIKAGYPYDNFFGKN